MANLRKPWAELSPAYRKRLERMGITPRLHDRGESLVRARGHFPTPVKRPGIFRRERTQSEAWKAVRFRARKLAAYDSIRQAVFVQGIIRGPAIEETLKHYEEMEALYQSAGPGGFEDMHDGWYQEMMDEYHDAGEFLYPDLDIYYHGTTKG